MRSDLRRRASARSPLLVMLGLSVVLVLLVSCGGQGGGQPPGASSPKPDEAAAGPAERLEPPSLGEPDAPVVMVEYGDYQ